MNVALTKKLMDAVKVKAEVGTDERELFRWTANLITKNRRKAVVVVNDYSRYGFVLYGVKSKEFTNLKEIILNNIVRCLQDLNIKDEIINKYIEEAGEIQYTKTRGPKYTIRNAKACEIVSKAKYKLDESNLYQSSFSKGINKDVICIGKNIYKQPRELMLEAFVETYGENITECEAAELEISLECYGRKVIRKVVTPINISFRDLHEIIQVLFDWGNCHLNDFLVYDSGGKLILNAITEEEELISNSKMSLVVYQSQVKITDYIQGDNRIVYYYDYGEEWVHNIKVKNIIYNYNSNYPKCIIASGKSPSIEGIGSIDDQDDVVNVKIINNRLKYVL